MNRAFYSDSIGGFLARDPDTIVGILERGGAFSIEKAQAGAWREQIAILREVLSAYRCTDDAAGDRTEGRVYFEYAIPRLGRRIDVVLVLGAVLFVLEFKVGERTFAAHAVDQVWDYALDLKNFHETSHDVLVVPVLIATGAACGPAAQPIEVAADGLARPVLSGVDGLAGVIARVLAEAGRGSRPAGAIDPATWAAGRYRPTPTIVEAATALYGGHAVAEISRSGASAINLSRTSERVAAVIRDARANRHKAICFVTGVPGAGKTLVGLNVATQHMRRDDETHSVFLSGNGPLVAVLREALTRDGVRRRREQTGGRVTKGEVGREVKAFVQNVHHFRDECLVDPGPPFDHVAVFDEAQRAWNREQTASFMQRKKGRAGFDQSEPEFLISCLDRHPDWATIVCLVGGGQEINTGEAGIGEWVEALVRNFGQWHVHVSRRLTDAEYGAGAALERLRAMEHVAYDDDLHLAVSMRSFRAERVSQWVKQVLDLERDAARQTLAAMRDRYPLVMTRDLGRAKRWLRERARGSERYGVVVSSEAQRLRPHAIDVRVAVDPVHWFLHDKSDVRSSYYLEDVATEFQVQGLELDWACVTWDGDFRYRPGGWEHWSFVGDRWNRIRKPERQSHQKNAYRVLLTRARQGMVICVPEGDDADPTRDRQYYDATFEYLRCVGVEVI